MDPVNPDPEHWHKVYRFLVKKRSDTDQDQDPGTIMPDPNLAFQILSHVSRISEPRSGIFSFEEPGFEIRGSDLHRTNMFGSSVHR